MRLSLAYEMQRPVVEDHAVVEETIERTALMRNYFKAGYSDRKKVNLVGHSMGGLVVATYLDSPSGNFQARAQPAPAMIKL